MSDDIPWDEIKRAISAGAVDQAEHLVRTARSHEPDNPKLHYVSGEIAMVRGRYQDALEDFRSASRELPQRVEVWGGLCEAASACGRYEEAFDAGKAGIACGELSAAQFSCFALSMAMLGDVDGAKSLLETYTSQYPDGGEAWTALGTILTSEQEPKKAAECFKKAIAIDPEDHKAHAGLGQLFLSQRSFSDAADHFATSLGVNPDFLPAHEGLIESLWQLGEPGACLKVSDKLLETSPVNRLAALRYGMSLFALKRGQDGEAHFRRVLEKDPEYVEAAIFLGGYLEEEGRTEEALEFYEQAHEHAREPSVKERLEKLVTKRRQTI